MKRPGIIWSAFAVCVLIGVSVLAWFTTQVLRLERDSQETRRFAAVEENVRLALWRLDSAMAVIQGAEAARPAIEYEAFSPITGTPSPLLGTTPPFVQLHLQVLPDGRVISPQALTGRERVMAIASGVHSAEIDAAATKLAQLQGRIDMQQFESVLIANREDPDATEAREFADKDSALGTRSQETVRTDTEYSARTDPTLSAPVEREQLVKSEVEQVRRQELLEQQATINYAESERRSRANYASSSFNVPEAADTARKAKSAPPPAASAPVAESFGLTAAAADEKLADDSVSQPASEGAIDEVFAEESGRQAKGDEFAAPSANLLNPVWVSGELFFVRAASVEGKRRVQAVWLDWPELHAWLAGRVADLLPNVRLVPQPITGSTDNRDGRRLAFLPVRIEPGTVPVPLEPRSPVLSLTLGAAWIGAALAVVALALLLHGTLRLSERRGTFVSAVTHELRTPLTTFRMYTEMLSGDMVQDPKKRRSYLDTLRSEAERLSHLVENVLSYARLERGSASSRVEETTPARILDSMEPRLRQRAEQANMTLEISISPDCAGKTYRTDVSAVDQIIVNLVDNAAKYGQHPDRSGGVIKVTAEQAQRSGCLAIRVADTGPGIAENVRGRLFQPFSKSATEAATSQPGVGLGLALCRRLARQELKGDLILERSDGTGTVFLLEIRSV